ncbi:putative Inositol hexakisphosphate [Trypanosoma vivax]|uniref:Inositol hexakisphosphate n=1 Tax=Trypanosoma vivax (strain Y486) TaxID=1055687 RepID=G0U0S7_TRYVY|nr:hypothetical protein TRVL_00041 [Trypanosoma vivax]KAH8608779.1 putative Inositol hexakisphosphate [Trypanosoma vivax]CCC49677.1 conserved hypothetical protein [Trypanosoma vivax Y486]
MLSPHLSPYKTFGGRSKLPSIRKQRSSQVQGQANPSPPSADELRHLKQLLHTQQDRLKKQCRHLNDQNELAEKEKPRSEPVDGGRRDEMASASSLTTRSEVRGAPHSSSASLPVLRCTVSPLEEDKEVRELEENLSRREARLFRMKDKMERAWEGRSEATNQSVVWPPQPSVLSATNEQEVIEMATLVYNLSGVDNEIISGCRNRLGVGMPMLNPNAHVGAASVEDNLELNNLDDSNANYSATASVHCMSGTDPAFSPADPRVIMELVSCVRETMVLPPGEVNMARAGDVLSDKHVLRADRQETLRARKGPLGVISGAPYFRVVSKLNVAGVAQPKMSAVRTIINELSRAFEGLIVWVNLRDEPLVYINDEAYVVRPRSDPSMPMTIPHVTGRSIAQIDEKLKREVLKEASENNGNVSVYMEGNEGHMEDQWESVDSQHVHTLQDVFLHLNPNVAYFRRPITYSVGPQPQDFDFIMDICLDDPRSFIVYNCQTGRGRTSTMLIATSIVRFYQTFVHDAVFDTCLLRRDMRTFPFRTIKKIVSLIPNGKLHERRLMVLMDLFDKEYSVVEQIHTAFNTGSSSEEAVMYLKQYAYCLAFSYYCEQRIWNLAIKTPFSQWLSENNEIRLLISQIQMMEEEFREERIAMPVTENEEEEIVKIIRRRGGNVLSANRILCAVPMGVEDSHSINALRQLAPDVPIFTCGRLSEGGRCRLVSEVRRFFPEQKRIMWISIRSEPMVFINDIGFTLADYDNVNYAKRGIGISMHTSLQAIEQIEERLRRDVLLEAQEHKGEIILHRFDELGKRSALRVKVCSVRTPKAVTAEFAASTGITYHRVPMPFSREMLPVDFDPLLEHLSRYTDDHDAFIINDPVGATRATVALNILTMYRASRVRELRSIKSTDDLYQLLRVSEGSVVLPCVKMVGLSCVEGEEVPKVPMELRVASTICHMLTAGSLLRVTDAVMNFGGRGSRWNILDTLNTLKENIGFAAADKAKAVRQATSMARTYLLVLLSVIYMDSLKNYSLDEPFSVWLGSRVEVANIIETLEYKGESSLKYVGTSTSAESHVMNRRGDVLTANYALKADHFPGCQKKGIRPEICGAPNFRKVQAVNVYGVAIPTILGIHNILSLLGASHEPMKAYPGEQNDKDLFMAFAAPRLFDPRFQTEALSKPMRGYVVWVNLREEPILYVGDKPFVFRYLETPYVNVELTGISAQEVERVERKLREDVLREAEENNGMFLVHDEVTPGELVGTWEPASNETVKTLRDIYDDLVTQEYRVAFLRLPVTDEQSPSEKDFDALVAALLPRITTHMDRRETVSFVFNCQMGRGRTTTGMVVCCLLIGLVMPEYYEELDTIYNPLYQPEDSQLSRGDYSCILQLKRVLPGGRCAKHHVDVVIEACSRMQNLRTATEFFALQLTSPDVSEEQRGRAHHQGVHYLRRYFNLISFAAYLDEEYEPMRKQMRCTFEQWLRQRPELTKLCHSAALK